MKYQFPKNFYWGTATSAHQIEGNNKNNDWWEAEIQGEVPQKSGKACDSYNRYEEDFDLAKKLNTNAHRLSIEWSRIEPEEGKFSEKEIEHYKKVIQALKKRGIEPFITLHHFTIPLWFSKKGGWENDDSTQYFERYTKYVIEHLGSEVKYWITINEPFIYSLLGYFWGIFPPQKKTLIASIEVVFNFKKAHKRAYEVIKNYDNKLQVGIAKNNNYFEAYESKFISPVMVSVMGYVWNKWFFNKIKNHQDFVGINYYHRNTIHVRFSNPKNWFNQNENKEISDFGWEIYPEGMYHVVKQAAQYKKPIYIFENGIADADDDQRPKFIQDHLKWLHKAIAEGADVRGYFHWSLLDNFEWAEGFTMKFGLVEVDFKTFERKPRPSFDVYKFICEANGLEIRRNS